MIRTVMSCWNLSMASIWPRPAGAARPSSSNSHLSCATAAVPARATAEQYGRVTAGDSPTFPRWSDFYRSIFEPIQAEVEKSGRLPPKCRKTISRATQKLTELLQHDDVPRLVHWDVWATNILAKPTPGGEWAIAALLDPNCKFAHVEAELAYLDYSKPPAPRS